MRCGRVDDTVAAGRSYGVLTFYAVDTGRLLEKEALVTGHLAIVVQ